MTQEQKLQRAALLTEWLEHFRRAVKFKSQRPDHIADVLTFGRIQS